MKNLFRFLSLTTAALVLISGLAVYWTPVDAAIELVSCPKKGFQCLDVYIPVICDGGAVFSNACYASLACATGCRPLGDATH